MPQRAVAFKARALAKAYAAGLNLPVPERADFNRRQQERFKDAHHTTIARLTQADYFYTELRAFVRRRADDQPVYPPQFNAFVMRDMLTFGLANSLRSSLDTFAHELVIYYRGQATPKDVHFYKLLRHDLMSYTDPLPAALCANLSETQSSF